MLIFLLLIALQDQDLNRATQPGPEAAAAYQLIEEGNRQEGFARLLELIREGSRDPWVYRGAALYIQDREGLEAWEEVLKQLDEEDPLAQFSQGYRSYRINRFKQADIQLNACLTQAPEMILARHTLGAVYHKMGHLKKAVNTIDQVLIMAPDFAMAQNSRSAVQCSLDILSRIIPMLKKIPKEWDQLPEPFQPPNGCRSMEVLTEDMVKTRLAFRSNDHLLGLDEAKRFEISDRKTATLPIDLLVWAAIYQAQKVQHNSVELSANYGELGLWLAKVHGRKDLLIATASWCLNMLDKRLSMIRVLDLAKLWVALPLPELGEQAMAMLLKSSAKFHFNMGENKDALMMYKRARILYHNAGDQQGVANSLRGEAEVLFFKGDNEDALTAYRRARALYHNRGSQLGEANTWLGEAEILFIKGNNEAALNAYERARSLYHNIGSPLGVAGTLKGEAEILFLKGNNEAALQAYRDARSLYHSVGLLLGEANTLKGEARILFHMGNNEGALITYRHARDLYHNFGDQFGEADTWVSEAEILFQKGDNKGALTAQRRARTLFRNVGSQLGEANTWRVEAGILFLNGDNADALAVYRQARTLYRNVGDQQGEANTWHGEAEILSLKGDNVNALTAYLSARILYRNVGDQNGEANTWRGEADILLLKGDNEGALITYLSARTLYRNIEDQLGEGNTWIGEARVRLRQRDHRNALTAYLCAQELYVGTMDPLGVGNSLQGIARIHIEMKDYAKAAKSAEQAVQMAVKAGSVDTEYKALIVEAEARFMLGQWDQAEALTKRAIERHKVWRESPFTPKYRQDVDTHITNAYAYLMPVLHKRKAYREALTYSEEARSRSLLDMLSGDRGNAAGLNVVHLRQEHTRLNRALAQAQDGYRQGSTVAARNQAAIAIQQLYMDLDKNQDLRLRVQKKPFLQADPLDAAAIQGIANEVGSLVMFYINGTETYGFVVLPGSDDIALTHIKIGWNRWNETVDTYLYYLTNGFQTQAQQKATEVWSQLLVPLFEHLPSSGPLTIIPHGPLHNLPFSALSPDTDSPPLFSRYHLTYAPSVSALVTMRARHQPAQFQDSFVAFASGQRLQHPAEQIHHIAAMYTDSTSFTLSKANWTNFKNLAPKAHHLLFATRGQLNSRMSWLEIAATPGVHDNRLTAQEISATEMNAELVTLAACDTAAAKPLSSDEKLDLARAFTIAGTAAVLATRWQIPDNTETFTFLADFYQAYRREGRRKDEALTLARQQAINRGAPAHVWAAWVLIGDAR